MLKFYAQVLQDESKQTDVLMAVNELVNDNTFKENSDIKLIGALVYLKCGDTKECLKLIESVTSPSLELIALKVTVLLTLNRIDLAKEELIRMKTKDEDSSLTQVTNAWINLSQSGEYNQEAVYIFQELVDKAESDEDGEASSLLLNALSIAKMRISDYSGAMKVIQKALKRLGVKVSAGNVTWGNLNGNLSEDVDLLVNFIACSQLLHKLSLVSKFEEKLSLIFKTSKLNHPFKESLTLLKHI